MRECTVIRRRHLLSFPRFLRVNITAPLTAAGLPEDCHRYGPLREYEHLNLSQLAPRSVRGGHYVLRTAIMYNKRHHWTYIHGQPSVYVSDETSRIATPHDVQMVARCARILIYEQVALTEGNSMPPTLRQTMMDCEKKTPATASCQLATVRSID